MKIEHTLTIRIIYQSLYLKSVYMQNAKEELNFKKINAWYQGYLKQEI